jgi:hypothetical protein
MVAVVRGYRRNHGEQARRLNIWDTIGGYRMANDESEMSDVVVILEEEPGINIDQAAEKLSALGFVVANIDRENDVIEGAVHSEKIGELKKLPFVKYVRDVFDWSAEQNEQEEDVDDAGA